MLRILEREDYRRQIDSYKADALNALYKGKNGFLPYDETGNNGYLEAWYLGRHSYTMRITSNFDKKTVNIRLTIKDRFDFDEGDKNKGIKEYSSIIIGTILSLGGIVGAEPVPVIGTVEKEESICCTFCELYP